MGNIFFACRKYNLKTIKIHGKSHDSFNTNSSSNTSTLNTSSSSDFQEWLNDATNSNRSNSLPSNADSPSSSSINKITCKETFIEEGELGAGGFSTVLLATRLMRDKNGKSSNSSVAIKQIPCSDPDQLENARKEIEITTKIASPYVIPLLTHGERRSSKNKNTKIVSLVFPVYTAGTLWDYLLKLKVNKEKLSSQQKSSISYGLFKGLRRIHFLNIAHCDLKTSNILLKQDLKTPIIMDFGSASTKTVRYLKSHSDVQRLQDWASEFCTACYRAPELFDCPYPLTLDLRACDIWSLGCCINALIHYQGPLDEIWIKGDSLGLAVQSISKYIGNFEDPVKPVTNTKTSQTEVPLESEDIKLDDLKVAETTSNSLKTQKPKIQENLKYKKIVEICLLAESNEKRPNINDLIKFVDALEL